MLYKLWISDGNANETFEIEVENLNEAMEVTEKEVENWVDAGEWGNQGAVVEVNWTLTDEDGEENRGFTRVVVPPDIDALIEEAGGDTQCDHDWSNEGEGGCTENPGVWSVGTGLVFKSHCTKCGLLRREYHAQEKQDTIEFHLPFN